MSWITVGLIMLVAGIAGGTINFALSRGAQSTVQDWAWAVAIGIGASFLMPLFLSTLSSNLLTNLLGDTVNPSDAFVFAGFCLLGAIASRAMIQTLTDKVLREARAARREVSELESAVAPILDKETEQDDEPVPSTQARAPLNEDQQAVLNALHQDRFSLRSISGISRDSKRAPNQVTSTLGSLSGMGLATEVEGKKGKRWALTPSGRQWIETA